MPSTYTHYRMGQEVKENLSKERSMIIQHFEELYLIGLHGPDILFYYHPFSHNPVNSQGHEMHKQSGRCFFENASKVLCSKNKESREYKASLAYIYGFICHFALDVTCHGYIDKKISESGISHSEIETELDRELMIRDGLAPLTQHLTNHIVASEENAEVIKKFYHNVSSSQVIQALKGMVFYHNILLAPSKGKRFLIDMVLRISGNYKEMHGLMINYEKNPFCADSTEILLTLYDKAKELAIKLITNFEDYLTGIASLDDIYAYTFNGILS